MNANAIAPDRIIRMVSSCTATAATWSRIYAPPNGTRTRAPRPEDVRYGKSGCFGIGSRPFACPSLGGLPAGRRAACPFDYEAPPVVRFGVGFRCLELKRSPASLIERRAPRRRPREQKRQQTQSREPSGNLEHRNNADLVGKQAEGSGREATQPE